MTTLSLLGLYRYNSDIFGDLQLPSMVDKDVFVNNLLAECAEFEILYADGDFLKFMIGAWSSKELPVWEKLAATVGLEYDPISNYDRTEEWDDTNSTTIRNNGSEGVNLSATITNTGNGSDTKSVAGYNSVDTVTAEKMQNTSNSQSTTESNNTTTHENTNETNGSIKRRGHAYGNIGVTTTQQMIEQERAVVKFNITDYIIDSFKRRFCLLIY